VCSKSKRRKSDASKNEEERESQFSDLPSRERQGHEGRCSRTEQNRLEVLESCFFEDRPGLGSEMVEAVAESREGRGHFGEKGMEGWRVDSVVEGLESDLFELL